MTETVKHTPGPWRAVQTAHGPIDIVIPDGRDIVTVYGGGNGDKEGNALLIAAAPEPLDATRKALNYLENTEGEFGITFDSAEACRAAIAKAEGRS